MDSISYNDIPLAHQLTCELLEITKQEDLDYYEINHVIALSLAVNEAYARVGSGATKYWGEVCDFYREEDIYGKIYVQVCENSSASEDFNICDSCDLDNIALFTLEYVRDELNTDMEYFNTDLSCQISSIVTEWQERKREKLAEEISDLAFSVTEDRTIYCWEKLYSYGYNYSDSDFSSELKYIFNTEIYSCEESAFLSALALSFPDSKGVFTVNREINTSLAIHFKVFRDAYILSVLGNVIESGELYSLTYDAVGRKLFSQPFYENNKSRQDYFCMVRNIMDKLLDETKLTGEDDMNCIVRIFFVTAIKGNPLVLSACDFTPQHVILFSKLLKDILLDYRQSFERGYERIMSMEG